MVSGHQAPAFTVASFATITAGRPSMRPRPRDYAGGRRLAVVAVVRDQQADFQEARTRVDQAGNALPRGHFAGLVLAIDTRLSTALA